MSRPRIAAVEDDFQDVLSYLKSCGVIGKSPAAELVSTARLIHSVTYPLVLWRFRIKKLPEHSKVFLDEIASDALQILPQVLLGYSKTALLLTRGIVENVFRHIYFADHPIEFALMNRERKWFLTMEQYYGYVKEHPTFIGLEERFNAVERLSSLHSDLSAGVHGRTVSHLETRAALKELVYDQKQAQKHLQSVKSAGESTQFLLAIFHKRELLALPVEDRRLFLRAMPQAARKVWTDLAIE